MTDAELYQQYLAQKNGAAKPSDQELYQQYLAQKNGAGSNTKKDYDWSNAPRDMLQTNVDALPMYMGAAGGALGMGVGSVPMAAGGYAAGNSLKNTINGLWHGNNNTDAPTLDGAASVAKDTAGALKDGAMQEMGGQILGAVAPGVAQWAGENANIKAVKTLNNSAMFRKMLQNQPDKVQELGQMLRDNNDVGMFTTPSRAVDKLATKVDEAGAKVGDVVNKIKDSGQNTNIDLKALSDKLRSSPELLALENTPGSESTFAGANTALDTLARNGDSDFMKTLALRRNIDKPMKEFRYKGDNGMSDHLLDQRNAIANELTTTADNVANSGATDLIPGDFNSANKGFHLYTTAEDLAGNQAAKDATNRSVSLTDTLAALAGLAKGGPGVALGVGALNKVGRTFGNGMQMSGYSGLQSLTGGAPAQVIEQAPQAVPYLYNAAKKSIYDN